MQLIPCIFALFCKKIFYNLDFSLRLTFCFVKKIKILNEEIATVRIPAKKNGNVGFSAPNQNFKFIFEEWDS